MSGIRSKLVTVRGEAIITFDCFGGECTVAIAGAGPFGPAAAAVETVRATLLGWHQRFSRFRPDSELSRLNADPRTTVPASPLMCRLAQAVAAAGRASQGRVDGTLGGEIVRAGYATHFCGPGIPLRDALVAAPPRCPAQGDPRQRWARVSADPARRTVTRPPDVRLDGGGLAKGVFADVIAEELGAHDSFAVDLCGDLRLGGASGAARRVDVESPFDGRILHAFDLTACAVATSGIGRRSWIDSDGKPAHHLLDPLTGRPAFTGLVQVTALAPTVVEAEWRGKSALLCGPAGAREELPHGGLLVFEDERHELIPPPAAARPPKGPRVVVRYAGGGTRTPDTRIMIARLERDLAPESAWAIWGSVNTANERLRRAG